MNITYNGMTKFSPKTNSSSNIVTNKKQQKYIKSKKQIVD